MLVTNLLCVSACLFDIRSSNTNVVLQSWTHLCCALTGSRTEGRGPQQCCLILCTQALHNYLTDYEALSVSVDLALSMGH